MRCLLVWLSAFVIATFCCLEANLSSNIHPDQIDRSRDVEFLITIISELLLLSLTTSHVILRTLFYGRRISASTIIVAFHVILQNLLKNLWSLFTRQKDRRRWRKPSPGDVKRMKVNLAAIALFENSRYNQTSPKTATWNQDPESMTQNSKFMNAIMAANDNHSQNPSELNKSPPEMCEDQQATPEIKSVPSLDQADIDENSLSDVNNNTETNSDAELKSKQNQGAQDGIIESETGSINLDAYVRQTDDRIPLPTASQVAVPHVEESIAALNRTKHLNI